jgi:hypothetical protein
MGGERRQLLRAMASVVRDSLALRRSRFNEFRCGIVRLTLWLAIPLRFAKPRTEQALTLQAAIFNLPKGLNYRIPEWIAGGARLRHRVRDNSYSRIQFSLRHSL